MKAAWAPRVVAANDIPQTRAVLSSAEHRRLAYACINNYPAYERHGANVDGAIKLKQADITASEWGAYVFSGAKTVDEAIALKTDDGITPDVLNSYRPFNLTIAE